MDVRENLVEQLRWWSNECDRTNFGCQASKLLVAAANYIGHGVTVQEWKPISEPPKEKGTYLVCTDNGGVLLGHWYGTDWNAGDGAKKHLAYWMEKPQPQKGE